jgi:hypothetical protein
MMNSVFPVITDGDPCRTVYSEGMSLRDYFAGQALTGILANQHQVNNAFSGAKNLDVEPNEALSLFAYSIADAMMRERGKPVDTEALHKDGGEG